MRIHRWQIDTVAVLLAGLLAVALGAPVRAQESAAPTTESEQTADAEPATIAPPKLADVDIDALLDHRPPDPEAEPASPAAQLFEQSLAAIAALMPQGGFGALRAQAEESILQLIAVTQSRLPDSLLSEAESALASIAPLLTELRHSLLLALGVLFTGFVTLRMMRGKGDLAVSIEYPSELRGTFSVRVARSRAKAMTQNRKAERISTPEAAQRAKRRAGSGSQTERTLVSRETQFSNLLA